MRKFVLLNTDGAYVGEYLSQSPRGAALKVATRQTKHSQDIIVLIDQDVGHLHVFRGARRPLREDEHTAFTRQRNITTRPVVDKLAYDAGLHQPYQPSQQEALRDLILHLTTG